MSHLFSINAKSLFSLLTLLCLIASSLQAAVIPGRWEKVDALSAGEEIVVTLKSGSLILGTFRTSTPTELTVITSTGDEFKVAKSEVERINISRQAGDSVVNGTLIGLAAGLALGGLVVSADSSGDFVSNPVGPSTFTGHVHVQSGDGWSDTGPILAGSAAAGALIGLMIDASARNAGTRNELIYQSR